MSLHELRPKHDRNMALAESAVERAAFHKREAQRYSQGFSVQYADAAQRHAVSGFDWVRVAIERVVECGCARALWPEKVREFVTDPPTEEEG